MKPLILFFLPLLLFLGCSNKELTLSGYNDVRLLPQEPKIEVDYDELLALFVHNCTAKQARQLYEKECREAKTPNDAESFFKRNFTLYRIVTPKKQTGLLTGYYEPLLYGSRKKSERYRYALYAPPKDMVVVDLSSIYPELRGYRLRGRMEGKRVVPYFARGEKRSLDADVICYVDDRVERFFLEIQGSGRVVLDNNETIFVGYADQNGHRYSSIGKYMIEKGYLKKEEISMQSIAKYLHEHPEHMDEILFHNASMVFFEEKATPASGALGLELTPMHSIAIDPSALPLGGMYYYRTARKGVEGVAFAQDTGGAIKGALRADLFCGHTKEAEKLAGSLKERLELWIFLPKREDEKTAR